ncbi:LAFE_0H15236g1_1 [Lachancea fermentati]|uniref:LAFE_0H15236g1_1 n=1 Tax=Lachancea fermentati TaxID=4955 RepID=A0A1G4MKT2_LACFM|nr:LAFE_0H15236g1_1 [Lachancea fermentati]
MSIDPQSYNDPQTYGRDAGARQRVRVRKACQTCKRRKVKCNGVQPCSNCVKHGIPCTYQFRELTPGDAPAARTGSTSASPELLVAAAAAAAPPPPLAVARGPSGAASIGPPAAHAYAARAAHAVPSPWQTFSSDKYRFHRRYQNVLPSHLGRGLLAALPPTAAERHALKVPRVQCYGWNMSGGHYLGQQRRGPPAAQWEWQFDSPLQRGIAEKLVRAYFEHINGVFSILHEKVFWQQYHNGFLENQRNASDLFAALLYLVLATALRFAQGAGEKPGDKPGDKHGDTGAGAPVSPLVAWHEDEVTWLAPQLARGLEERLFETAHAAVSRLSFEWESFELIQAWLLIAAYLRTCHRQTSCWQALGRAVRMCNGMALYLNRFPAEHAPYDETRARSCFWSCFMLDKVISFQMGRTPELPLPAPQMVPPAGASAGETWFCSTSVAMCRLSLIIESCQRRNGEELGIEETCGVRAELRRWAEAVALDGAAAAAHPSLALRQVFLTYLDVRLTLEIRGLHQLLRSGDPAGVHCDDVRALWPLDAPALVELSAQAVQALRSIVDEGQFFVPWWLNLSLLFTASITCVALIDSGLQLARTRPLLKQCFDIWHYIEQAHPQNPPGMAAECIWCLKMLSHMSSLRLQLALDDLTTVVGVDHGDDSLNKNRFRQFGKVDDDHGAADADPTATVASENDSLMLELGDNDDLLSHIQWFDQWFDINSLDST